MRRLFHLEEDLGRVNREKNSERGRGGEDQSTSRRASTRSSAVTFPQSIFSLFVFVSISERNSDGAVIENGRKKYELKRGVKEEENDEGSDVIIGKRKKKETEQVKKREGESIAFYL